MYGRNTPKKISKNANGWKSIYLGNFEFGAEVMAWQKNNPTQNLNKIKNAVRHSHICDLSIQCSYLLKFCIKFPFS